MFKYCDTRNQNWMPKMSAPLLRPVVVVCLPSALYVGLMPDYWLQQPVVSISSLTESAVYKYLFHYPYAFITNIILYFYGCC